MEFEGEVWVGDIYLVVISREMVFKVLSLDEIIKGVYRGT